MISYLKYNPQNSNKAIFYIHGFLGNKNTWKKVMHNSSNDHSHISIDLPGYNKKTLSNIHSFEDYVNQIRNDIEYILKKESIKSYIFISYSMGARLSMYMLIKNLIKPSHLIVESSGAGIHPKDIEKRKKWDNNLQKKLLLNSKKIFLHEWYDLTLFKNIKQNSFYSNYIKTILNNDFLKISQTLDYCSQSVMPNFWGELYKIKTPTLILYGEWDKKYKDICLKLKKYIPNSTLKSISNASHNTHLMNHQQYIKIINKFLKNAYRIY